MKKIFLRVFSVVSIAFLFFAAANLQTEANRQNEKSSIGLSELTMKIVDSSARLSKEGDLARDEFKDLAAERFENLKELAKTNPSEVLRVALPPDVLAKIPLELQTYFEKPAEITGELEIISECETDDSKLLYFLKTENQQLALYFNKKPDGNLLTGARVRVKGVRIGDALAADENDLQNESAELNSALPNTTGEIKVLVLLVNFQDNQTQPYTTAQANNLLFNTSNSGSVTNYYREASYGKTWITGDAYGWFTLPMTANCDANTQIATYAKQAAANAGINLANYNKFMYVYPQIGCSYSGRGGVGGSETWINGSLILRTTAHELGHTLGLYHAKALDCGTEVVGGTCTTIDYGHQTDVMGYPGITGNFHPFQKERLGWLNSAGSPIVTNVQTSGNYFIAPVSTQDSSAKALKILKSTDASGNRTWYYVEFRQPVGFDSFISGNSSFTNGVIVTMDVETDGFSNYMLDMTPATTSWADAALAVNRSYTDSTAGITITPLSVGSGSATVSVSFGNVPAPTCVLANPTISATPTATQWIGAGSAVTYAVTVTNNNGSGCSDNTFNLQNVLPGGWSAANSAPSLTVAPGTSGTANIQVVSPNSAASGFYTVAMSAANSSNANYTAQLSANLAVYSALNVSVSPNQSTYTSLQTVTLTANVAANGTPMAGANVTFTVSRPDGTTAAVGTIVSGANGSAVYTYKFNRKKDMTGTYRVTVNASLNGVSGSGLTSFNMTK